MYGDEYQQSCTQNIYSALLFPIFWRKKITFLKELVLG